MEQQYKQKRSPDESLEWPKHLVQLRGPEVEAMLQKSVEEGYGTVDVTKVLETPAIGKALRELLAALVVFVLWGKSCGLQR